MKRFSEFTESCTTSDVNQGNGLGLGVTNHLTPVNNIVTNVRNLFPNTYIVVSVGEDGVSVKLNSSRFISKEETQKYIYEPVWQNNSIASYIMSQGLDSIKMVNLGMYFVVYFYPSDIKFATPGKEPEKTAPVKEQFLEEAELDSFISESDDDEELKDLTKEKVKELIGSSDKVKAAKQLELLVGQELELPREYYFAGVKDKQGNESIALRWKYTIKRPKGMTSEITRSILNIYGAEEDGIWVGDFDEDSLFKIPDDVRKLIESILDFLGAKETDDPCVWSLAEAESSDDDKKDEEKPEDLKKEEEDVEDDKSRSESDDLLG
ncbi:MAG: hypothetical protein IJH39_12275 [Clostridia bacterium]|nr:hypothetical protein [Clostridia bacterium]